jgi:hypothetical protein
VIGLPDVSVLDAGATPPAPGSREELTLAAAWSDALADRMERVWREGLREGIRSAA